MEWTEKPVNVNVILVEQKAVQDVRRITNMISNANTVKKNDYFCCANILRL